MVKIDISKIVDYWQETAQYDYETMLSLFESERYASSLFFGHIVLEKILKGLVVAEIKEHAPYSHDLKKLNDLAKLNLVEKEIELLNEVNDFNISARYPEYKMKFYQLCTRDYTQNYLEKIILLYKKLCQQLREKTP